MQYVRNLSDSVSTAWNSLNPATLSGAIDVIVVEQEDGTMACSPFHVRFGKFQLLRPSDKKVEFKVNGVKQNYAMKLGEGGEAFFVFETRETIPQDLQTSPLASPASSPSLQPEQSSVSGLQEPELLELDPNQTKARRPPPAVIYSTSAPREDGMLTPRSASPTEPSARPKSGDWTVHTLRPYSDDILRRTSRTSERAYDDDAIEAGSQHISERSHSPPPLPPQEAIQRAIALAKELSAVNIPSHVTETGDLMLDMTGFKSKNDEAFRAEILARKILSEELEGNYDIGALFGMDEQGNLWIYSSEDAKEAAMKKTVEAAIRGSPLAADAVSDPGYQSDGSDVTTTEKPPTHRRTESDLGTMAMTPPGTPPNTATAGDPNLNYAKTLRLTSDQLKALNLKPGENSMSFTVGRSTCTAYMFLWRHDTPVVISDIDGTITKSDALGHLMNMVGRDWTHIGVAKLYSDIVANGYNIMYLTSRSVGQADTTRAYLNGIVQDGYRLPRGPTILSPDRTMAALRREIYLRKPHVFKMATLRDIRNLYGPERKPFIAGYGNRFSDQISYRTVDVPGNRIFTINSNAEVVLDVLSLNKRTMSYRNINEIVDHYFPPVATLVREGREDFTDFMYWREPPLELDEFSASDSDEDEEDEEPGSQYGDDDDEVGDGMGDSYISHASIDDQSVMSDSYHEDNMISSMIEDRDDADDEDEEDEPEDQAERTQIIETSPAPAKGKHVEEDINAEVITGVKHLSLEKEVGEKDK